MRRRRNTRSLRISESKLRRIVREEARKLLSENVSSSEIARDSNDFQQSQVAAIEREAGGISDYRISVAADFETLIVIGQDGKIYIADSRDNEADIHRLGYDVDTDAEYVENDYIHMANFERKYPFEGSIAI